MRRLLIILALLLATLTGAAQTFGAINLPTDMCAGTVDTFSFGLNSEYNIYVDTTTTSITRADRAFLPDGEQCNGQCSYSSPITFSGFATNATITSVNDIRYVRLNMEHSFIGDIYIGLTCPDGRDIALMKWRGSGHSSCTGSVTQDHRGWSSTYSNTSSGTYFGIAYDYTGYPACDSTAPNNQPGTGWNYCWSNAGGIGYASQDGLVYRNANSSYIGYDQKVVDSSNVATLTNFYHPDQSFSNLIGCPINGQWTIEVIDAFHQDNGYIFEWEMSLAQYLRPSPCQLMSHTIIAPEIEQIGENEFVFTPPAVVTTDTTIYLTLRLFNSCDETIDSVIAINIHPAKSTNIEESACDSYQWYNNTFTESTQAQVHLRTRYSCDSLVTLNLTVNYSAETSIIDTIVENELPYISGVETLTEAGEYTFTHETTAGCDSLVDINLTVWLNVADTVDTTVCRHQLPIYYNNSPLTTTEAVDTFIFNLFTWHGADSTVYLATKVNPDNDTVIADEVVQNSLPVTNCGFTWTNNIDTVMPRENMYGCDSMVHYSLVVWPNVDFSFDTTVCINQLPLAWKNHTFSDAGTVTLDLQTVHGADSTVTLTMNTNPVYAVVVDTSLCDNLLPLVYLDSTIQRPQAKFTSYNFMLQTIEGCDSAVTLNLTVLPTSDTTIWDTTVQNNLPHMFRSTSFSASGNQEFHTVNTAGCDSAIYYNLQVWFNDTVRLDTSACSNHTPFEWHGETFTATTTTVQNLYNIHGADSIVFLHAYIPPAYDTSLAIEICDNHWYNLGHTQISTPGHYDTTLRTIERCDSVVHLDLGVNPTFRQDFNDTTCRTSAYVFFDSVYRHSGIYTHNIPTVDGCDSLLVLHLALKGVDLLAKAQISPLMPTVENKHINLRDVSEHAIDRLWLVGALESHQKNISIDYPDDLDSLEAMLIAYSDDGCADTAINIIRMDNAVLYAPNAFTPNQTDNNRWSLVGMQIATLEVWIYNREGLLVYHYDDVEGGWDGNSMDGSTQCPQGAYVYRANYTTQMHPTRTQSLTGTILLIR